MSFNSFPQSSYIRTIVCSGPSYATTGPSGPTRQAFPSQIFRPKDSLLPELPYPTVFPTLHFPHGAELCICRRSESFESKKLAFTDKTASYLGSLTSGWSAVTCGSPSTTSRPAPHIQPCCNAIARASESTRVPRLVLMRIAVFFIFCKKAAFTRCFVLSPPGASTNTTSLSFASSSRSTLFTDCRP